MRVLGIDPGIARTGWGVIEEIKNSKFKIKNCGCIETSSKKEVHERLEEIYLEILRLIKKYSPDTIAIEELFFNTNAKTAFVVGQARGVVLLAGAQKNLPIGVYTPLQVKIAVTGYGRAEKSQIGKMVKTILNLQKIPKPDDTADALAVALTHAFSRKMERKI
ncbi:MAG: crossover junction endodeoxyribonuclease RuvC [Candidatus Levybacteria bacterium RIFCSPLOWO2_01_FULL_38_21]|nr:MAG: crossover junction endodeoxyribonuclease RuvC [Candidatus Levybacteria bacterium RIFCSPLOWO2_01_FULL_38_21]